MPGSTSQAGQVGFRTQAVQGTYLSPGTGGIFMKLRSGGLGPNRELLIPDPEIGGGRDTTDAYLGAVSWSGDYEFYARMAALPTLLKAAFGTAAAPVTATGVTTHTITPLDSGTLPFLSVEERIGSGLEVFNYTDAVVNSFHLEADANGYLMGTAGLIARLQTAGNTATVAPTWDNTPMVVGTNITVQYNGVTLPAKSFSLDFTNNFEDDDFRLGSFYLGDLVAKSRELTLGVTIRPQDSSLWRQAVYGTAAATAPGGQTTKQQTVITMTTYEDIVGGTPPTKSSLALTIPQSIIAPFGLEPSGDDIIENDMEIRAIRPNPGTPLITAVVKTGQATIA
jgi:hypothetical protein